MGNGHMVDWLWGERDVEFWIDFQLHFPLYRGASTRMFVPTSSTVRSHLNIVPKFQGYRVQPLLKDTPEIRTPLYFAVSHTCSLASFPGSTDQLFFCT